MAPVGLGRVAGDLCRSAPALHRGDQTRGFGGRAICSRAALDEAHLLAAARYIALNPVVAGLVSRAEDWPWSSTRVPLASEDDELATVAPLRALVL